VGKLVVKRICAWLLVLALMVGFLGVFSPTLVEATTNEIANPNRTHDQARRDIAQAIGMDEYLNATISTLHDFHYGDILQMTAAVFILDGDRSHGKQAYLDNWVEMYRPFYDRIPIDFNFAHIFYLPDFRVDNLPQERMWAVNVQNNPELFLERLRQLPNFAAIDTIIVMDHTTGSEPSVVELDGKTYYFVHASIRGAIGNAGATIHGAIHGFQGTYTHETARTVINIARIGSHTDRNALPRTQAENDAQAGWWRSHYPNLPHYTQWDATTLHTLSRRNILSLPPEVGMPTTRQSWSGGNPDHGWNDFRAYTYFELATQAELDYIFANNRSVGQIVSNFTHYFVGATTLAEWDTAVAAMIYAGARRPVMEYVHYLRVAQTSPKSITQVIDPMGNQIGWDVALAKWLRNMRTYILPDGTSWHDLNLHSRYFEPTFHQLPVRGAGTTTNPNPTSTPPPANEQPSSWARTNIARAEEMGLLAPEFLSGFSRTTTRAEFTALAVALYEHYTGTTITGRERFDDTSDVNVEKAAYLGIVTGVGNNRFNPDGQLTREMAAVMLARLANVIGQPLPASAPTFADNAQLSSWARDGVGRVQAVGIMGGVGNNIFAPRNPYTIEQSIVSMMRLYDLLD